MAELVLLEARVGSRIILTGCPECGIISHRVLSAPYAQEHAGTLARMPKCRGCGTIYLAWNDAGSGEWAAQLQAYRQDAAAYNESAQERHALAVAQQGEDVRMQAESFLDWLRRRRDQKPAAQERSAETQSADGSAATEFSAETQPAAAPANSVPAALPAPVTASATMKQPPAQEQLDALDERIVHWKSKLLDLSKRNRMLNYRETRRSTLKIIEPGFAELFNRLALNEEELTFQRPVDRDSDLRTFSILSLLETLSYPLPVHIGDIRTEGSILERQQTLRNLRSKSKLARDEQGANILYLSFGFIEWREKNAFGAPCYRAPVLMMPVSLHLEAINAPFTLSRHDDEIEVNPTLDYFLGEQFGVDLPAFELKDADSIDQYMNAIEEIVDRQGWRLIREVSMGLLSFLKISMYHDLENNRGRMLESPVIRAIAGDNGAVNNIPAEYRNFDFDRIHPSQWYQVVNSDSSQQEAILLSKMGVSFVMQGPPGTGKSQTITNIIAEALADGKKVLFVSEKAAALQVVLKRLAEVHLDDFCLALHSHKANKKEILDSIGSNLNMKHARVKDSVLAELTDLFHDREYLNTYANELHAEIEPLEESLYTIFGRLSQLEDATEIIFEIADPLSVTAQGLNSMLYCVGNYEKALRGLDGRLTENPWHGAIVTNAGQGFQIEFLRGMNGFADELQALTDALADCRERFGCAAGSSWEDARNLRALLDGLLGTPLFAADWADAGKREYLLSAATAARDTRNEYAASLTRVRETFDESVFALDLAAWTRDVRAQIDGLRKFSPAEDTEILSLAAGMRAEAAALRGGFESLLRAFTAVSQTLQLPVADDPGSIGGLGRVCRLILNTTALRPEWFNAATHQQARQMHGAAREHVNAYRQKRAAILEKWELTALSIDAEAMLIRFKTQYNSLFKGLRGDYRADMRTLRAVHRTVGAKISDADAIELLQQIGDLNAERRWFAEQEGLLGLLFGAYYAGIESDWDGIARGLSFAEELMGFYPGAIVPEGVIDLVCRRSAHADAYREMLALTAACEESELSKLLVPAARLISALNGSQGMSLKDEILPALAQIERMTAALMERIDALQAHIIRETPVSEYFHLARDAQNVQAAEEDVRVNDILYTAMFGARYAALDTDWDGVTADLESVAGFCDSEVFALATPEFIEKCAGDAQMRAELADAAAVIGEKLDANARRLAWFNGLFAGEGDFAKMDLSALLGRYLRCAAGFAELDRWLDYAETKAECDRLGLEGFTQAVDALDNTVPDVLNAFKRGFYSRWCAEAARTKPSVQAFRRRAHEERIGRFSELDEKQLTIAQARVRERVISHFPDTNRLLTANDEVRVLQHELGKKRRIMPLRRLFREIPNLLLTLKPCLMMSPLSVAYFLEAESYQFDMVIFDEASQIFPQDAIGAIFRARQAIIAGDSRQLPPTNFFAASTSNSGEDFDGDGDEYDDELYDSILEETADLLPNRTLRWHYRSRHEHLIAFSNREIYQNELVTFPSSREAEPDAGVEFDYVEEGVYEGGGRNCNLAEARRCVELVRQHIERHPDRSLGIIAFSEKQQQAITQQIQRFREQNPKYESFFAEDREGEFFVKNLENVQGDERDTIIFSICYARTARQKAEGKPMAMRFGPLGQQGGERRLNVAITRAKHNVKLVSSILPSDIDLERTQSEGIRLLRAYIEFARSGSAALRSGGTDAQSDDFVETIAAYLGQNGYSVRRHVGCSGYKIDIAVEHPGMNTCFVAGIECDGYSYAAARTARDRDHLRKSVLESMGWNMYRVWSAEWRSNPLVEGEKLLDFVKNCIESWKEPETIVIEALPEGEESPEEMLEEVVPDGGNADAAANPYGFEFYREAQWQDAPRSRRLDERAENAVLHIIGIEQPIHAETLCQRMAGFYDRQKVTALVRRNVENVLQKLRDAGRIAEKGGFLTLAGASDLRVRIAPPGREPRQIAFISPDELGLALTSVAANTFGLTQDGLIDETARALGYARRGDRIGAALEEAFARLVEQGKIRLADGKISLLSEQ